MAFSRPTIREDGRSRTILWWLSIVQCLVSALLVGLTIALSQALKNVDLYFITDKEMYSIVISFLTFGFLTVTFYLEISGWNDKHEHIWWNSPWCRITVSIICVILWIAASYTAFLQCSDLCYYAPYAPEGEVFYLVWEGSCCQCYQDNPVKESCSDINPGTTTSGATTWGYGISYIIEAFTLFLMFSFVATVVLQITATWGAQISRAIEMPERWQVRAPRPHGEDGYAQYRPAGRINND